MFNKNKQIVYVLSLVSLVVLSGCWGKKKNTNDLDVIDSNDNSLVLLKINGNPKITVDSLEADINEIADMDQQLKLMMMFNPEETRERVFQEKKRMAIIDEWARKNNIADGDSYSQKRNKIMKHVDMQLNFEEFLNQHKVDVSDADVLDYYNQNKEQDPRILVSQAGVKSQAVEFSTHHDAQHFYNQLKHAGVDSLENLAKEHKHFVRNLGNVNEASYADQAIKDAVLKITKFPAILLVENTDKTKFWVVVAQGQEAVKYQEFDKVKDSLKQMLISKAMGDMLDARIPEYAKSFDVVENDNYFNELKNKKQELMQDLQDDQDDNSEEE